MQLFDSSGRNTPFWRETLRLYLSYMSVGVAAIPAGVLYGVCVEAGYARWWTAFLSIISGLWCGRIVSKWVGAKFPKPTVVRDAQIEFELLDSIFGTAQVTPLVKIYDPVIATAAVRGGAINLAEVLATLQHPSNGTAQISEEECYASPHV